MSRNQKGTNYKYGIQIDIDGSGGITEDRLIPGSRESQAFNKFAAADVGSIFWTAPVACKFIRATERHVTIAGQPGTMSIEKVPSGTAPGSGTVVTASAIDLQGTANTNQTAQGKTDGSQLLAAGDSLALKLASGAATSLAGASMTVVVEWQ